MEGSLLDSNIDTDNAVKSKGAAKGDQSTVTNNAHKENNDNKGYPILGYFRLGMTEAEYQRQSDKILAQTAIYLDKWHEAVEYYISIGGITFDVRSVLRTSYINVSDYESNKDKYSLFFFTGNTYGFGEGQSYFIEVKDEEGLNNNRWENEILVSMTFPQTKYYGSYQVRTVHDANTHQYTPQYYYYGSLDVLKQCSQRIDSLKEYLTGKFGTPVKTSKISVVQGGGPYHKVLSPKYVDRGIKMAMIPCAEWKQGEMTIVLGVSESGCITLSFVDNHYLSREYLDSILEKEKVQTPVPKATW